MFSLFRIWKAKIKTELPGTEKTANFLARRIIACQHYFVKVMSGLEQRSSPRQRNIVLVLFFGLMSACYIVHFIHGFSQNNAKHYPLDTPRVHLPPNITLPDSLDLNHLKLQRLWERHGDTSQSK